VSLGHDLERVNMALTRIELCCAFMACMIATPSVADAAIDAGLDQNGSATSNSAAQDCERNEPYHRSGSIGLQIGCGQTEFYARGFTGYKAALMMALLGIGAARYFGRGKRS
jgi:hypothetical protein